MLDSDLTYIGCGNKLAAKDLINMGFISSFSDLECDSESISIEKGVMFVSVDTVMPATKSIEEYTRSAYYHCANDLYSNGVSPAFCTISFGLSVELTDDEKKLLVSSTQAVINENNVNCINYHTLITDQTSITFTLFGFKDESIVEQPEFSDGMSLILSKPISLYNTNDVTAGIVCDSLLKSNEKIIDVKKLCSIICKDVSGFGLVGSIAPYVHNSNLKISLFKDAELFISNKNGDSYCSIRRNTDSFKSLIQHNKVLSNNYLNAIYSGQTNGPMLIFTNDKSQTMELLRKYSFDAIDIGIVTKKDSLNEIDFI